MRASVLLVGFIGSAAALGAFAQQVTCESKGKQRQECEMNTQGEVVVARQLSKTKCQEGVNWGLSKHAVWVENGCRAVFENRSAGGGAAPAASPGLIPLLNASCPTGIDVHADEGGPVYVNGKEASLKKFNDNYFEARQGGVTISLTRRPDGTMDVSYTGAGGANGVCTVK